MIERVGATRIRAFSADALRAARDAKGWTQGRLAVAVGVSLPAVASWERGTSTPEAPRLPAIAEALNIEPGSLLTLSPVEWTLAELRVLVGLQQASAAAQSGIAAPNLSKLEMGYQELRPVDVDALSRVYGVTPERLKEAWQRGRDRLLET